MSKARDLADFISDSAIDTAELADNSVTSAKLDETDSYTVDGLTSTGGIDVTGSATISSDLVVDTNDLFVDSDQGNIGIGTTDTTGFYSQATSVRIGDTAAIYARNDAQQLAILNNAKVAGTGTPLSQASYIENGPASYQTFYSNGEIIFENAVSGTAGDPITWRETLRLDNSGNAIFNEDGNNFDFRVESNNNTNMLFVDASADKVGIGTSSPTHELMVAGGTDTRVTIDGSSSAGLYISDSGANGVTIRNTNDGDLEFLTVAGKSVVFNQLGSDTDFRVESDVNANSLFVQGSDGAVGIGTSSPANTLHVSAGNPFLELQGTSATSGDTGIFINANGNHWILKADNFGSTNQFQIKQGDTSSSTATLGIDSSANLQFNSGYGSVATAYGCRAWVNFNGTGTVAIRASGNVSSVTDNSTGDYTLNFSTAMPDANYNAVAMGRTWPNVQSEGFVIAFRNNAGDGTTGRTTSNIRISSLNQVTNSTDSPYVGVSIFR